MINTILLYDNQDTKLGAFFTLCANKFQYLHNTVYKQNTSAEYNSENCEKETIESALSAYNNSKFLFVSFLHGSKDGDAMLVSNQRIVSFDNAYFFTNAFCYTFSCYCGKNLATILLQNNACVFWGYSDKAYSITDYEEDFSDLAISGLKHFYNGKAIDNAYNAVKEEYTNKIYELYKTDYFSAATLLHNRDSMVVLGDKNLTVNDFLTLQ